MSSPPKLELVSSQTANSRKVEKLSADLVNEWLSAELGNGLSGLEDHYCSVAGVGIVALLGCSSIFLRTVESLNK